MKEMQTSETLRIGILLAISGGFMDAYSYLCRGEVFANAQTGNMLLLGVHLSEGDWAAALRYAAPVTAFAVGIAAAALIRLRLKEMDLFHWRQLAVLWEAVILFLVAWIPLRYNLLANSLTSLACGMQVESFRKIHGNGIATTMCIGNLRSATQSLCEYMERKDKKYLKKSILYYGIILFFIIGAIVGNYSIARWGTKAIMGCSLLLGAVCLMMFAEEV